MRPAEEEEALDAAWSALDEGRPADALEWVAAVDRSNGERAVVETWAWLDLVDWIQAEESLAEARELLEEDDPMLLAVRGEWELVHWRIADARGLFERAARVEPTPRVLDRLALCADFAGEHEEADEWLRRVRELDLESGAMPARLTEAEFEAEVARAAEELPPEFRRSLETIPVLIDAMPDLALTSGGALEDLPPDLLGLFVGRSALDGRHDVSAELPPRIHLFQRNLERSCSDPSLLREEIRVTLYHELAHALGFDEDGVESMGLE